MYVIILTRRFLYYFSYVEDFPGLVHFIFVDRVSHQMTAPAINVSSEDTDKMAAYIKQEVGSNSPN